MTMSVASDKPGLPNSFSLARVLLIGVPVLLLGLMALVLIPRRIDQDAQRESYEKVIDRLGLNAAAPSQLDPRFKDADGDLVADCPADAGHLLTPARLVFSYIAGPDATEEIATWQDFAASLSKAIGTPVDTVAYATTAEQYQALRDGALHISGFNTGAVPTAVTQSGFVPLCTFGREDGTFGSSMRLIVTANSTLNAITDLKYRTLAFTSMDSNSGYNAAVVLLRDHGLLPQRDYQWRFSGSHQASIEGIVSGLYEAAPVSDDLLQRAIATGEVDAESIRTIYESERFPPATMGCVYNLPPNVTAKIRQAFLEYSWEDSALAKQFGASNVMKFVPISYKQDFAVVRRIHDAFSWTPTVPARK
jgi:phosphonate transport system substrate-binding protein